MGDWKITSQAGSVTATAPPNAPNVTFATGAGAPSAYYGEVGNVSTFGLQGTINLPTSDPAYSHLEEIDLKATLPDGSVYTIGAPLYAAFSGSTATFKGPCNIPQVLGSTLSVTITATVKNDAGVATASPATATVTVQSSAVSSVTAVDASTLTGGAYVARTDDKYGSTFVTIEVTPVLNGGQVPQAVAIWLNFADGAGWHLMNVETMTTVGQVFKYSVYAPTNPAQTGWQAAAATGWVNQSAPVATLPAGAQTCSLTVAAVGAMAATGVSLSFTTNGSGSLYDYGGPFDPGYYTWRFHNLQAVLASSLPDGWDVLLTVQEGTVSGGVFTPLTTATGAERQFFALSQLCGGSSIQPLAGTTQNIAGPTAPVSGTNVPSWSWPSPLPAGWCARIRAYGLSRLNGGTQTLLTGWPSSADHFDLTPSLQAAPLQATRIDPSTLSNSVYQDPTTKVLKTGTSGNPSNMFNNWSFEDGGGVYGTAGAPIPGWLIGGVATQTQQWTGFGHSGQGSFRMAGTHGPSIYQQFTCKAGETYHFESWAADYNIGAGYDGAVELLVYVLNASGANVTGSPFTIGTVTAAQSSGVYVKMSGNLTIPATGTTMVVLAGYLSVDAVNSWWFIDDCVCRLQTPTGTNPAVSPDGNGGVQFNTTNLSNMVINSGFETGDLTGWTIGDGNCYVNNSAPYTGKYECVFIPDPATHLGQVYETVTHSCRPGDQFYAECYASSNSTANGQFVLEMYFFDSSGNPLGAPPNTYINPTTSYTKLKLNGTAPANAASVRLYVYCQNETGASAYWLCDNVWLAPQPSTGSGTQPDLNGGVALYYGPGTQDNGAGAITLKVGGIGIALDGSGNIAAKLGAGVAADGSNNITLNLGTGLQLTGSQATVNLGNGLTASAGAITLNLGNGMALSGASLTLNLGNGLQLSGAALAVKTGNGISISGGAVAVNAGNGINASGSALTLNLGGGLTMSGSAVQVQTGNGVTLSGGSVVANLGNGLTFSGSAIGLNLGNGLAMSGSALTLNLGNGVSLSGGALTLNLGNGLTMSGSQVIANLGGGLTTASGTITLNLGGGLIFSGTVVQVNAGTGLALGLSVSIANGGVGPTQIASVNFAQLNAGSMNVGSGGTTFTGSGGISIIGGGSISVTVGTVSGYTMKCGPGGYQVSSGSFGVTGTFTSADGHTVYVQQGIVVGIV